MRIIDSHTGGEPTRIAVSGVDLRDGRTAKEHQVYLQREADWIRTAMTLEPRAAPWMVGAVMTPPPSDEYDAGVVFFNNLGYLGMCGHGMIGLVETLAYLGRIGHGRVRIDTPVGPVGAMRFEDGSAAVRNVRSYRYGHRIEVATAEGPVTGDIAYGGNWFFLAEDKTIGDRPIGELTRRCIEISESLVRAGVTGEDGAKIDHIELCGPPSDPAIADARNFVLCPGREVDRSPCGTGTSAKLACLAADGLLAPGQPWRQESITGSVFTSSYEACDSGVLPTIHGRAFITGDGKLVRDPTDPLTHGFQLARDATASSLGNA